MYSGNVIEHPSSFCIHYIYLAVVEAVCNSKSNIIVVPALYYKLNKEGRLPFVKLGCPLQPRPAVGRPDAGAARPVLSVAGWWHIVAYHMDKQAKFT